MCAGLIWLSMVGGRGPAIGDQKDFDLACMTAAEMIEYSIENGKDFSAVESLLDNNRMAVRLVSEGEVFYEYGALDAADEALLSAAASLGGNPTITLNDRGLFVGTESSMRSPTRSACSGAIMEDQPIRK